jgi:hypothetical protein
VSSPSRLPVKSHRKSSALFIFASMAVLLVTIDSRSVACAQPVQSGILTCRVVAGFGRIIGSARAMSCRFERGDGVVEDYDGRLGKIGLDFGYLSSFVVVWAVLTSNATPARGALEGSYYGANVQAAAILGVGVNAMTGGSIRSIALQPISVEGGFGLYIGGGFASMTLWPIDGC